MSEQNDVMAQAVARGVALLDAKVPGWWQRIDVAELDMYECSRCVLGQLFLRADRYEADKSYGDGLSVLKMADGRDYGFDLPAVMYTATQKEVWAEWDALRELWVAEIKRRFDEGFDV